MWMMTFETRMIQRPFFFFFFLPHPERRGHQKVHKIRDRLYYSYCFISLIFFFLVKVLLVSGWQNESPSPFCLLFAYFYLVDHFQMCILSHSIIRGSQRSPNSILRFSFLFWSSFLNTFQWVRNWPFDGTTSHLNQKSMAGTLTNSKGSKNLETKKSYKIKISHAFTTPLLRMDGTGSPVEFMSRGRN